MKSTWYIKKSILTAITVYIIPFFLRASAMAATASPVEAEKFADALMEYRLPDGGVLVEKPRSQNARLVPYFANLAALGWTETAMVTSDTRKRNSYLDAARSWMDWYASHQNPDGTIYDYEGDPASLEPTGKYDSTDSYPATYAILMWRYYVATQDTPYLEQKIASLDGAYKAMFLTVEAQGLTYAKPGYYYRYLMDNCEVAAGLAAFEKLYTALDHPEKAAHAQSALNKLKSQIAKFYQPGVNVFGFAIDPFGKISGNFTKGYPDAMANLFALTFLAPPSEGASDLLDKVEATFWNKPDAGNFPQWWVWAAMVCGDTDLEHAAMAQLKKQASAPAAHSYLVGMAAAILCSGTESIRMPEAVSTWQQLITPKPEIPVAPAKQSLAGPGSSLFITERNSTATIAAAGWRAISLSLPARIEFEITTSTGYVLANLVLNPPLNLQDYAGLTTRYTAPANVPLQFRMVLVEDDGDWWDSAMPETDPGENVATLDFRKLKRNAWGKSGDGKFTLSAIRGVRFQFDNKASNKVNGEVVINEISLTR